LKPEIIKKSDEAEIAVLRLPNRTEYCITMHGCDDSSAKLRSFAQKQNALILNQFVFAGSSQNENFGEPVVRLQGDACRDGGFHSIQAFALSGILPSPVRHGGRDIGFIYEDDSARYCRLTNLLSEDRTISRGRQARAVMEIAAALLGRNGFSFRDVVRTWIYLDRLLDWYDEFNAVRTAFFNETGIFDHLVPASTGIGAGNPFGSAIVMNILAVQPKNCKFAVRSIASPLQSPALDYKSSFSRAVELESPTHRNLAISGTASIAPNGNTAFRNEPEKQIRFTMEVVKAILVSRGMDWSDLFRGIAYFKDMDCLPIYRRVAAELKIPPFPLAVSHADICRRDLFFEIEADAIQIC
jgi:enamine deaminase RidA (YjgF/YER057c/UK114 family)